MSRPAQVKESLKEGEHYAGLILGKNGAPDHHLVLLPGDAQDVTWSAARDGALFPDHGRRPWRILTSSGSSLVLETLKTGHVK